MENKRVGEEETEGAGWDQAAISWLVYHLWQPSLRQTDCFS